MFNITRKMSIMRAKTLILFFLGITLLSSQVTKATTVSFQAGDGGSYSTTEDSWMQITAPNANMGTRTDLRIRDVAIGLGRSTLIRFPDIIGSDTAGGQIPTGVMITNATLELTSTTGADTIHVYRLTRHWDEGNLAWDDVDATGEHGVTWNKAEAYFTGEGTDVPWEATGAEGLSDRITYDLVATSATDAGGGKWKLDITSAMQDWVDGITNCGIILVGYDSQDCTYQSSETATASDRPKLTVSYGVRSVVDTSGPTVDVSFQHGDGGLYSDTTDTWIQEDDVDRNAGLESLLRIRGYLNGDRSALIAFPDIIGSDVALGQIPLEATISNATLRLKENLNMNSGVQVAMMLRDWDAGNLVGSSISLTNQFGATWNRAKDYYTGQGVDVAWETTGAQGNSDRDNANIIDTDATETTAGSGLWEWDVTAAVQAWANGTNNYGIVLFRNGDSINASLHSANAVVATNRPLLTITYIAPPKKGTVVTIR